MRSDYQLPIILGVTGHRDLRLEDIPRLEQRVREIFDSIQKKYSHSPIQLISPLAEGADRLVARIALELKVDLIVPLPMPRDEYEKDFKTPESKIEFSKLLAKATLSFELPLLTNNTLENIQTNPDCRNRQYAQAGAYVADHSQILIALWDGVYKNSVGGTSNIIRSKEGTPELQNPSQRILDPIEGGPVYHIVTPHISNPLPQGGESLSLHKRFPGGLIDDVTADQAYQHILKRMDDFNQDAIRLITKEPEFVTKSKNYLIDPKIAGKFQTSLKVTFERYALADALAIQFQKKRRRTMIGLFVLVGLAVVCLENYDGLAEINHGIRNFFCYLLPVYLSSLAIAFLWHYLATSREYQNKHLEYRALAEGLRIQFFWNLAGIGEDVSEHYLRKQRSELEWIRNAVRSCLIYGENDWSIEDKCGNGILLVIHHWVKSQGKYYQAAAKRDEQKLGILELIMKIFISLGVCLSFAVLVIDSKNILDMNNLLHKLIRITMQILPAIGAAFGGYAVKMALSEQVGRYDRMGDLYLRVEKYLTEFIAASEYEYARQLIRELGDEALIENGDWLFLHRERPMEVPMGG